jgi:hypothetical protein
MDKIKIRAVIVNEPDTLEPRLCVELKVNELKLGDYLTHNLSIDLNELRKTLQHGGEFFIITCACGNAECAGIRQGIKVIRDDKKVSWVVRDRGRDKEDAKQYIFDSESYTDAVKKATAQFLKLHKQSPNADIVPAHLRRYIQHFQALI